MQQANFNSIKVRLKLNPVAFILSKGSYFNSIKVRLKPAATITFSAIIRFQFHKGTIKTNANIQLIGIIYPYFNSIKVRLKHGRNRIFRTNNKHFNSIKVRLKHQDYLRHIRNIEFQFHKGTIKTKFWQLNLPARSIISIP